MNKSETVLQNEHGSVILVAIVMLVLITLIGLAVIKFSDVDVQVAKNEREYVENFYAAESAWRQAVEWIDNRSQYPDLVNKDLFVGGDTGDHALNVRNYGDGGNGILNTDFDDGTEDGVLGTGRRAARYWYKIAFLNSDWMSGVKVEGGTGDIRKYAFRITSIANGTQRVDVTITKILKTGE